MLNYKIQKGVGLVEVLVALIVLALGVLGYTALQLRAVDASGEALVKSQAILVMRGLTESIRANESGQGSYPAAVQSYVGITPTTVAPRTCLNQTCTPAQMATFDAFVSARAAQNVGIQMTMVGCPGTSGRRQCLFAAWDDTQLQATTFAQCMGANGVYVAGAKCVMMEAY
ncbi:type IV pilus modification protein PilV [Acinetobacter sp. A3.8]|uniref:Type IV pilus modification protein PilV n=1 Tax=Acinetobacter sedimenti TaxID=2919922 RepID=A0A9X2B8G9_9GAMM|nr:type IV pilus modification protein PilV [Acinetobacter sedimenti]MCJ8146109.1 type IV pilus modification protein PilV [Acinetobacter sedimenti]